MAKTKISEFSATAGNNTDIDGINIAENCPPSGINDAIRELMSQLKDFQTGAAGDSFNGPVGTSTAAAGAFTTLSASGAVTLSGGTANGVAYLNGSKVLTTGSALVFDGSNLGLGVTPSASTYKNLQINTTGVIGSAAGYIWIGNNWVYNGGDKYIANGTAQLFGMNDGGFQWYTAPSGTAGNAISFTQAMTLDASGNLLVGATSSSGKLTIKNPSVSGSQTILAVQNAASAGTIGSVTFNQDTDAFGVINNTSGGALFFSTNNTERARIDSSGNLLVGTTAQFSSGKICAEGALAAYNLIALKNTTTYSAGQYYQVYANSSGTIIGGVNQASQTTLNYATSSDARLKENIVDAPSALQDVCAVRVRSFDWKDGGEHQTFGVIAQEVLGVVPEAVSIGRTEDEMMGVDYSKFVPRLLKAIQEQQTQISDQLVIINQLKARLDAANL